MSKFILASLVTVTLVPVLLQACGGTSDVTIGEDGTPDAASSVTPTPNPSPNPTTTTPPSPTTPDGSVPPTADASVDSGPCPTYYRDEDGDGFGGATKQTTCTPPGAGWVVKAGDCNDTNKAVFPGQPLYFGTSYAAGSAGTGSFDYDCSAKEEGRPGLPKASACAMGVGGCAGEGFLPVEPGRPGTPPAVDPYCGSTRYRFCRNVNGQCVPTDTSLNDRAYDCH